MPPKRSNKRKADETLVEIPRRSKRVRPTKPDSDESKTAFRSAASPLQKEGQGPVENATVDPRTRSGAKKRVANNDLTEAGTSRAVKRQHIDASSHRGVGEDVNNQTTSDTNALLLPIELHNLILENFRNPRDEYINRRVIPNIRAYAGVCRLWRVAALPYLYRTVGLQSMKSIREFSAILDGDPSIGNYVHRILLVGTRQLEDDRWMYAFPSLIKVPLPALRVLDIRLVRLVRCSKEDVRAYSDWILALPAISSVQQLHLGLVIMPRNALTSLVCALPSLTTVWLESSDFRHENGVQLGDKLGRAIGNRVSTRSQVDSQGPLAYPILHPPPLLECLRVSDGGSIGLAHLKDWLYPSDRPIRLTSFNLMPSQDINLRALAKALPLFFLTLEELGLSTQEIKISEFEKAKFSLSHLPRLKTFRVYAHIEADTELNTVCHFLSLLEAPRLETFSVSFFHETHLIGELEDVDRLLANVKYAGLKEVIVNTMFPWPAPPEYIESHFPLTSARGILKTTDTSHKILQLPWLGVF